MIYWNTVKSKDVNLVLEALEAKIAALQVADKTN